MYNKLIFYTCIILFPFFWSQKAVAQQNRERHRQVTITQTVIDGKVVSADTLITYTDTTTRTINSKEVSLELPYTKGSTVFIDNSYRKLNIRQSKDGKVKLSTIAFFYGEPAFTNEQWLEKLNITMKKADTGIVITSGGINRNTTTSSWSDGFYQLYSNGQQIYSSVRPATPTPPITGSTSRSTTTQNDTSREVRINGSGTINGTATTTNDILKEVDIDGWVNSINNEIRPARSYSTSTGNSTAVFDDRGNNVYNSSSLRRELTIYIPADVKLNLVSKYADVTADHDLKNLRIKISNGSLDMVNADNVVIVSAYSNISCGNLNNADITATNGKLSLKDVNQLTLNTKYSKVALDNCNALTVKSTSDDYDLDVVKNITGTKTYGNLRVDKLTGSLDLKGSSADVKIKNIEPSVSMINVDNKYADVQLPVTTLKNYEVAFTGNYSSVFAPFERRDTTIAKTTTTTESQQGQVTTIITGTGTTSYGSALAPLATVNGFSTSRRNGQAFTATVGDTKGTHTIFKLICNSCNVDFK